MLKSLRDRVIWFRDIPGIRPLFVGCVDHLQRMPGQLQILVPALTFYCMCKGAGINPFEVLQVIERMERDVDGPFANQWAAMTAYAKGELK